MSNLYLRGKAFLVDFVCGLLVPSVVAQAFVGQLMPDDALINSEMVAGLFVFLFVATYWIVIPYAARGQTIGKWIFGLRIVSSVSERLSLWQITLRTLCYVTTTMRVAQMRKLDFDATGSLPHDVRSKTQVVPS